MKVLVNRKPVEGPWGGGNLFVKELVTGLEKNNHQITYAMDDDVDCIFLMDPRPDSGCPGIQDFLNKYKNKRTPIIHRVNECDSRKNTEHMDNLLLQCSQLVHETVFVSRWMQDYFLKKGWVCRNIQYIHNGVDKELFKPRGKKSEKIPSVVAHHWSNNLLKGFDAYEFLDYLAGKGKIEFTYIGRHRGTFLNTNVIKPISGKYLGEKLSLHDVYISGSRFDPGPNHVLEALSSGLPTYVHRDGGGAVEFAGDDHTFSNLIELENIVLSKKYKKNKYSPSSWEDSIEQYVRIIEKYRNENIF